MGQPVKLSPEFDNKFIALKIFFAMGAVEFSYRVEQSPKRATKVCRRDACGPFLFGLAVGPVNTRSLDLSHRAVRGSERRSG